MATNGEELDDVRRRLIDAVDHAGTNLATLSRALGRNHAYLHQFVFRGSPKSLSAETCRALGRMLGLDPGLLDGGKPARTRLTRQEPPPAGISLTAFARRLTIARLECGFDTPVEFCAAAGLARGRFADLEDGIVDPTMEELDRIAAASGKSFDWLIRGPRDHEQAPATPLPASDGPSDAPLGDATAGDGFESADGSIMREGTEPSVESCYPEGEDGSGDHTLGGRHPNRRVR